MRTIAERRVEVTVRRPNGQLETITHPKVSYMTVGILEQMRRAMTAADKGEVLSYRNIAAVVELDDVDYQGYCERCGEHIDSRTAPHRRGYDRGVAVVDYYCRPCWQLHQAMQDGAEMIEPDRGSVEPVTKEDY